MNNPFKKDKHTALIGGLLIGAVAAGVITFLFLTDSNDDNGTALKKKIRSIVKDAAANVSSKTKKIKKKVV